MKKLAKEFSEFLKQGNLIQIATGLLLASSFNALVTSFSNSFIMPIINKLLGFVQGEDSFFEIAGMKFPYGVFVSALISFIIIGLVLFAIVKAYNKYLVKEKEDLASSENELSVLQDIKQLLEEKNK
ncbi:MscL family protein [Mycoplasma sp. P36-A1]|uniref:large conductance mechanosensitive channel protein MscL n=1 Tax=Mycoplasma sp. P36-A1 TaxID=3252900 RepID=UPI003C2B9177